LHTTLTSPHWQADYIRFELRLLQELGFGLDLSECAATGAHDHLIYVSPKSGRAVSADAGKPYHDKLLPLPYFLKHMDADHHITH
ncbi:DNA repair protein RecO, partial [bacterium LRH843]|nr:DNA repair protein RecO [bacterium LRH843]